MPGWLPATLAGGAAAVFAIALLLGPAGQTWSFAPDPLALSLRWPRVLGSVAAGAGMAVSGVILQRLLRDPLASPEIVGISSGASLALVTALVLAGTSIREAGAPVALLGSLLALAVLLWLARRSGGAPGIMALAGISLAATLDAGLRFVLARGGDEAYMAIGWLAGSTFSVTEPQAVWLLLAVALLAGLALALSRPLELLGAGDEIAAGRGLPVWRARPWLLTLAAVLAAIVTAAVGPVAFVGLVAPHLSSMLGARRVCDQLVVALLIGHLPLRRGGLDRPDPALPAPAAGRRRCLDPRRRLPRRPARPRPANRRAA